MARLFTSIFELAVDTTLQCFLCCEEPSKSQFFEVTQVNKKKRAHNKNKAQNKIRST